MPLLPRLLFAVPALLALPCVAAAQDADPLHPYLDLSNRHVLMLGGTSQTADATLSATRRDLPEVKLDLDDLGTEDRYNSWMLEYRYRINENWGIAASAFTFKIDGNRTAERDFNYGGVEYQAGVALDTELQVDTYILDVMYALHRSDRAEILLGGGLHMFDFSAGIKASAFVGEVDSTRQSSSEQLLAPLPNFRAQGFYAFTPRIAGLATLGWLSADYEDYEGDFVYLHARLHYRFDNGFGVSGGYQFTDVNVAEKTSTEKTRFDIEFQGPTVQLSYSF